MRVPSLRAALPPVLIAFVIVTGILANLPLPMWLWWAAPPVELYYSGTYFSSTMATPEPGRYYCGSMALQDGAWDDPINSQLRTMSSLRVQAISRTFGSRCTSVPPPETPAGPAWFGGQESSTRLQNWNHTSGISSTMAGAFGGSSNRYCAGDCSSFLHFSRPENGSREGRAKDGYDVRRCGLNRSGIAGINGAWRHSSSHGPDGFSNAVPVPSPN